MTKGVLIECFGLPGSGKTTLCTSLRHELGYLTTDDVRIHWWQKTTLLQKLKLLAGVFLEAGLWRSVTRAAWRLGVWKSPDGARRLATLPFLRARTRMFLDASTLALDQLLIQEVWSALVSARNLEPDSDLLADLLTALYRDIDVLLVCLHIDAPEAAERVAGRTVGYSRFDGLGAQAVAQRLAPTAGLVDRISDAAELSELRVRRLDARRQPSQLLEDAISALEEEIEPVDRSQRAR